MLYIIIIYYQICHAHIYIYNALPWTNEGHQLHTGMCLCSCHTFLSHHQNDLITGDFYSEYNLFKSDISFS